MTAQLPHLDFAGPPVSIAIFHGPIDLLAYLIRNHELDIQEIPVSHVTEQFVRFVRTMEQLRIEEAAEFLPVAATLVLWKIRSLLPRDEDEADDEGEQDEDIEELLRAAHARAAEYEAVRQAAEQLREAHQLRQRIFLRSLDEDEIPSGWVTLENVHIFDMVAALEGVLRRTEQRARAVVLRPRWSVRAQMRHIVELLRSAGQEVGFEQLFAAAEDRLWVIVTFLALLELIRRGQVRVRAGGDGRIHVSLAR